MKTPRLKPKKGWAVEDRTKGRKDLVRDSFGKVPVFQRRTQAAIYAACIWYPVRVVRVLYAEPIRI